MTLFISKHCFRIDRECLKGLQHSEKYENKKAAYILRV